MLRYAFPLLVFVALVACYTSTRTVANEQNEDVSSGWTALEDSAGFQRYEKEDTLYYIDVEDHCLPEYTMYHGDTLAASHRAYCD